MLDLHTTPDPYKNKSAPSAQEIAFRLPDHRGRTSAGRFTNRGSLSVLCDNDFPPNSPYWARYARGAFFDIGEMLGKEYFSFADLVFPGETIQSFTWRTICEMLEASLDLATSGERDIQKLADAAHAKLAKIIEKEKGEKK